MSNIATVMSNYPYSALRATNSDVRAIAAANMGSYLIPEFIHEEIDLDNPVVAGISPSDAPGSSFRYPPGLSRHVALIIGIEGNGPEAILTVNDPYPFTPQDDPYTRAGARKIAPGQYEISARSFAINLNWTNTINLRAGPVRN